MSDLLSVLRRAERLLAARLGVLASRLPPDGSDHAAWGEYVTTVAAFLNVIDVLTKELEG